MSYPEIRDRLIQILMKEYGFLDYHDEIIDHLRVAKYTEVDARLAAALQRDLRAMSHDNHFSVSFMKECELFNFSEPPKDQMITVSVAGKNAIIKIREFANGEDAVARYREIMSRVVGARHITVDLRGCPGGYVDTCCLFLSFFIPKNVEIFCLHQPISDGSYTNVIWNYVSLADVPKFKGQVTVIIDRKTFSAAQITAWALRKWARAKIVGAETLRWSHTSPVYKGITVGGVAFKFAVPNRVVMEHKGKKYQVINFDGIKPDKKK